MKDTKKTGEVSQEAKQTNMVREILSWVVYFGVVILLTYLIIHFVGQRTVVNILPFPGSGAF